MGHGSRTVIGILTTIVLAASEVPQVLFVMLPSFLILRQIYLFTKEAQIEVDRVEKVNSTPRFTFQSETLAGLPTIRAYKKQQLHREQNFALKNNCLRVWVWCHTIGRYKDLRLRLLSQLFSFVITALCIMNSDGSGDASTVIFMPLLITYCEELTWQFGGLFWVATDFESRMKKAYNCFEMLNIKPENFDGKVGKELDAQAVKETGDEKAQWPQRGSIEFKDVVLKYRPECKQVLTGLNFTLTPGQKLGVIGRTGAGKSTLCLAISRLMEIESGKVIVDGQDIREVDLNHLRSKITVIP